MACYSINNSLEAIYAFLRNKGLELSPSKSKCLLFSRLKKHCERNIHLAINNVEIPQVKSTKFLSIILDNKLNGAKHIKFLIKKEYNIVKVITSLIGTKWGTYSYLLISLYRSVYRSSIEYGVQVLNMHLNRRFFLKLQRQQYQIIRKARFEAIYIY